MFKKNTSERLIAEFQKSENSNFKCGSIVLTFEKVLLKSLNKINELGSLPQRNQQHVIITRKMINSFDFILAICQKEIIVELTIAFYRISKKAIIELRELQKRKKIDKITFLINDGFPKLVTSTYNLLIQFKSKNWLIKLENNHTKIILAKTNINNYYVIEGSGNLSINARIEQYRFENSEQTYNFHKNWIDKI